MSIATDMLNPRGRMTGGAFVKAGLILTVITFAISLLSLVNPIVSAVGSLITILLIYPWVVIWVKRLHQADASGWMFLLVLVIYLVIYVVMSVVLVFTVAPDVIPALSDSDPLARQGAMTALTQRLTLPAAICSAIISAAFVLLGNMILKNDLGPNRFGPPPAA